MVDALTKYRLALSAFTQPGGRWNNKGALTYWGKAAGLSADDIISDARAAGVHDRDGDIRKGWADAEPKFINGTANANFTPRAAKPKLQTFPHRVRSIIHAGRDVTTLDGLAAMSAYDFRVYGNRECRTHLHIKWLFPDDAAFAYIFRKTETAATPGVLGKSVMRVRDWFHAEPWNAGEQIVPNPFTGEYGTTANGTPSLIAQSCLAAFPHMLMEFDDLPIAEQCRFWAGFIRTVKLPLVCLTHSGGKSIHGCIKVNAANLPTWNAIRERMLAMFAADNDPAFRVDAQAMMPRQGMRLAGAVRQSTGDEQRLLWLSGGVL